MAEPTAPPGEMTTPEQTVARARAIARDLGARLYISPSDLELYDELASFLTGAAPAMRSALAALDELSPAQLRRRLAAIGAPLPPEPTSAAHVLPPPPRQQPGQLAAAPSATAEAAYVSPWPTPEPEPDLEPPAAMQDADDPEEGDSWLREWDREALLGGVEQ